VGVFLKIEKRVKEKLPQLIFVFYERLDKTKILKGKLNKEFQIILPILRPFTM
jgi:hypothetical protein